MRQRVCANNVAFYDITYIRTCVEGPRALGEAFPSAFSCVCVFIYVHRVECGVAIDLMRGKELL